MPKSQIRVLCVDDYPLVREGIIRKVDLQPDMKVIATAVTGEEAVALFRQHRPDSERLNAVYKQMKPDYEKKKGK